MSKDIRIICLLGKGTYGRVYLAYDGKNGRYVAIKKIKCKEEEGVPASALREIHILKKNKHENIVKMYDVQFEEYKTNEICLNIYLEYMDYDLHKYIYEYGFLTKNNIPIILKNILKGVYYLHKNRYIHRDIKPQNILINENNEIKLCDFGLSRQLSNTNRKYICEVTTLWYRAPELFENDQNYTIAIDMWSIGCIFAEMIIERPLLPGENNNEQIKLLENLNNLQCENLKAQIEKIIDELEYEGSKLLFNMLEFNPKTRISSKKSLQSKYFWSI